MTIVIVDDDKLVSLSLNTILGVQEDITVIATGDSGRAAIELYDEFEPDVILMDIRMEDMTGLEAAEKILSRHPKAKILLLTTFSDDEYIVKAISLGAKGYILKQEFESIAPALRAVNNGQTVFGTEIVNRIPHLYGEKYDAHQDHEKKNDKTDDLTDRNNIRMQLAADMQTYEINDKELSIIELIAEGLNNKEISEQLFLSEGTVRNYISTILEKTQLRDRTQLACFYYKKLEFHTQKTDI